MTLFRVQVCKVIGFYEFTRLIISVTYKTLFSSRYKFLLVRYLKKKLLEYTFFNKLCYVFEHWKRSTSRHAVYKYVALILHQISHTITAHLTVPPLLNMK